LSVAIHKKSVIFSVVTLRAIATFNSSTYNTIVDINKLVYYSNKNEGGGVMGTTHRMTGTSTYNIWSSMITRTKNINNKYYGARGIRVCKRWEKFENFLEDMGEKPEGKTLDRKNNNGNYNLNNCKWSTSVEQANNRSTSFIWVIHGIEYNTTDDAAEACKVSSRTIFRWYNDSRKKWCTRRKKYESSI